MAHRYPCPRHEVGLLKSSPASQGFNTLASIPNQGQHSLNPLVTNNDALFDVAKSVPFFSSANATLDWCNSSPATPTVYRNSIDTLSLTLEDEEDNARALMTFSSSPTITAPSHVSTKPQCIKTSIRSARHCIPSISHMQHLPRNHLPMLE